MNADILLHWLMRTSLEAGLLILVIMGLRFAFRTRLSPAWRFGLWILVGAKLMLPAFIPAGFGLGNWFRSGEITMRKTAMADVHSPGSPGFSYAAATVDSSLAFVTPPPSLGIRHIAIVSWVAGALLILAVALRRQSRFNKLLLLRPRAMSPRLRALIANLAKKAGVNQPVSAVLMPAGATPAMVGILRPKLLLPEDWETRFDERSLSHVVLHELLHVKRGDLFWNWAATAVQALHWFNPLVWFAVTRFQADRELRCDAAVLALLAPGERLDYGHTLLRIQETFFAPPAIAGLAPCVRNHPTLHQRILMITTPSTRQPWLQFLLVLTLSVLGCYSFTTADAAEKEGGATGRARGGESGEKKTGPRDGEDGARKSAEGDGGIRKVGPRDGEGGAQKPGARDGEGARNIGPRDGEGGPKKTGAGDIEGTRKPGARDGERPATGERDGQKSRTGARDGEGPKEPGARDGEGSRKTGARDGDKAAASGATITLRVIKGGEAVMIGDQEVAMNRLRSHLSTFLPEHPGAKVIVTGEADIALGVLHNAVDAVRDNGNKKVSIKAD
jgi:bla regulator protein BlaR1